MASLLLQLAGLGVALAVAGLILVRPWWIPVLRASLSALPTRFRASGTQIPCNA